MASFLILDFKALKVVTSFNLVGIMSQVLGPKNDCLSVLLYVLQTGGTEKCVVWRSSWFRFGLLKTSVKIGGAILL